MSVYYSMFLSHPTNLLSLFNWSGTNGWSDEESPSLNHCLFLFLSVQAEGQSEMAKAVMIYYLRGTGGLRPEARPPECKWMVNGVRKEQ